MRMSDWSSDVCSSDLQRRDGQILGIVDRPEIRLPVGVAEEVARPEGRREKAAAAVDRRVGVPQVRGVEDGNAEELEPGVVIDDVVRHLVVNRSEEHTSELQSLMRISYAVFCLKKKKKRDTKKKD